MPTVEIAVSIDSSPESLAAVLLDAESAPTWTAGLDWLELVDGAVGEPGCVGRAHYVEGGRRYILEDRLVDVIPNRYYKSEIIGGGIKATVETTLTSRRGDASRRAVVRHWNQSDDKNHAPPHEATYTSPNGSRSAQA